MARLNESEMRFVMSRLFAELGPPERASLCEDAQSIQVYFVEYFDSEKLADRWRPCACQMRISTCALSALQPKQVQRQRPRVPTTNVHALLQSGDQVRRTL